MKFKNDFFRNYLLDAPLPLALERVLECELLSKKEFKKPILDIGCGEGIFANKLFAEKIDTGIDPNPRELERAKFFNAYDELIECKGDNIPKGDGSFNTIFSNSVLEHIPEIEKVLQEAHRLLSADGRMYLTLPTDLFEQYTLAYSLLKKLKLKKMQAWYRNFFNSFWCHYHFYNRNDWTELFASHQFKVVDCQEYASKCVCLVNALMTPLSIIPFLTKKFCNRWFIFVSLRRALVKIWSPFFDLYSKPSKIESGKGGLIFFELIKDNRENS